MSLNKDFYKALKDVLGLEYISDDPAVLDSYMAITSVNKDEYATRFEAILLPKDTEEVQAIVRLCNKYEVKYKASSTGWQYCDPVAPGCIKIDLRRMNRIIEINEKNMYAVVEPHVIFAQLQAELMKRGLNCNVTGAGSNCSALPVAAHVNLGHLSQSGSFGDRNQLAIEWVTPGGEIIRLGTLGSSNEWFCGDGPGPSLRGIIRGDTTPLGGLGVFTKAAQKVYHWPGPSVFPVEGSSPYYEINNIPSNFIIRYFSFPTVDLMIEAVQKIGESEIGFVLMGFNRAMLCANLTASNEEDAKLYKEIDVAVQGPGFVLALAGNSPRDFEYKKRVMFQIISETRGKSLELVENPKVGGGLLWSVIRISRSVRELKRAGGGGMGVVGGGDVFPLMTRYIQVLGDTLKADLIKKGVVLKETTDPFCQPIEHSHLGHGEMLTRFSAHLTDVNEYRARLYGESNKMAIKGHYSMPQQVWNDESHDWYGPYTSNYHLWLRKIKKTFDPKAVSESTHYISAREEKTK